MLQIASHLLAMLFGPFLLAARSILLNLLIIFFVLAVGVFLIFHITKSAFNVFDRMSVLLIPNILLTLLVALPITTAVATFVMGVGITTIVVSGIIDIFKALGRGIKAGYLHGIDGVWEEFNGPRSRFSWIGGLINYLMSDSEQNVMNEDEFEGLGLADGGIEEALRRSFLDTQPQHAEEVPDLEQPVANKQVNYLKPEAIAGIEDLIRRSLGPASNLGEDIKRKLRNLSEKLKSYSELHEKMNRVQNALKEKQPFDDELIPFTEVEKPILLVKQYKDNTQWRSVPASSYITDKDNLMKWLKEGKAQNPINRDPIKTPSAYNGHETRYTWHPLTEDNCYSQELDDKAEEVRNLYRALISSPDNPLKTYLKPDDANRFFEAAPVAVSNAEPSMISHTPLKQS